MMAQPKRAFNYLYRYDFTKHAEFLKSQPVGEQPSDELVALLKETTGDDWNKTSLEGFSLVDAVVEYNGLNDKTYKLTNSRYKHILTIKLGSTCTELRDRMYFHYN